MISKEVKKELKVLWSAYKDLKLSYYIWDNTPEGKEEAKKELQNDREEIWQDILKLWPEATKSNIEENIYTEDQLRFIDDFRKWEGLRYDFPFCGDLIPAVHTEWPENAMEQTDVKLFKESVGMEWVVYPKH